MPRKLKDQVVVITGASSGIGRLSAIKFGGKGASVVLAARNEAALREAGREVEKAGGRALVVPTDVAEWHQVQRLAKAAVDHFGRIDTWVNDAGVSAYATIEQLSVEEIQRIIQVDLMGMIHGVKAALPYMKARRQGTLINVSSVLGVRAAALQGPYSAAKHGVKGFTEALRLELDREHSGINVTLILPASIDTPFFSNAPSRMGVRPRPLPPVYQPSDAADAIVYAAEHPRRDIFIGGGGKMFDILERISPSLVDWFMLKGDRAVRDQLTDTPDDGRNNLFRPNKGKGSIKGEFGDEAMRSVYTRTVELHPTLKPVLVGVALLGAWAVFRSVGKGSSGTVSRITSSVGDAVHSAVEKVS